MSKQERQHKDTDMKEDTRIALLEQSIGHIDQALMRLDTRFDSVEKRFDRLEDRLDSLNNKVDSNFKWLLGITVGSFAGIVGFFSHVVHLI